MKWLNGSSTNREKQQFIAKHCQINRKKGSTDDSMMFSLNRINKIISEQSRWQKTNAESEIYQTRQSTSGIGSPPAASPLIDGSPPHLTKEKVRIKKRIHTVEKNTCFTSNARACQHTRHKIKAGHATQSSRLLVCNSINAQQRSDEAPVSSETPRCEINQKLPSRTEQWIKKEHICMSEKMVQKVEVVWNIWSI